MPVTRDVRSTSKKLVKLIAEFALDKKAEDIAVLDMRKVASFCDYFVICSGTSDRQIQAIADGIEEGLSKLGVRLPRKHASDNATWMVLDAGDVVVHIFEREAREFYGLEYLWQDAPKVAWKRLKT